MKEIENHHQDNLTTINEGKIYWWLCTAKISEQRCKEKKSICKASKYLPANINYKGKNSNFAAEKYSDQG